MKKYQYCIIGSGIGAGSLIGELKNTSNSIIVVEAGGLDRSNNVQYSSVGRPFSVRTTTAIQLGGTSNLWHGVLAPLDPIDFEKRDYIANSGWPIDYSELEPFYKKASTMLGVSDFKFFSINGLNDFLRCKIKDVPFNPKYFKNKLFQQPTPPLNFKSVLKDIFVRYENVDYLLNTPALELIFDSVGSAQKLKVGVSGGGFEFVHADTFIVCAGALESPRLLLNSSLKNNNVGRYFMDHPMGNLCQIKFKKSKKAPLYSDIKLNKTEKIKSGISLHSNTQKRLKLPNHNFFLRPSFIKGIDDETEKVKLSLLSFKDGKATLKDFLKLFTNLNALRQILIYKLSLNVRYKYADLFFVTEQLPNPNSTVRLSNSKDNWGYPRAEVNWKVLPEDIESMKSWYKLVLGSCFSSDQVEFTHGLDDFKWTETYTSAIHHVGTCRMAESESFGVVDKNLRVFSTKNLYVCDGSVFPTSGNVNSSLTISALACRLASHLENGVD